MAEGEGPPVGAPPKSRTKWYIGSGVVAVIIVVVVVLSIMFFPAGTVPPAENLPPQALATSDTAVANVGQAVAFDASASSDPDGQIVAFNWVFGDGAPGTGMQPSHAFADPGAYIVFLTVTDDGGANGTNEVSLLYVNVLAPETSKGNSSNPTSIASSDIGVIEAGNAVQFDGLSSWAWLYNAANDDFDKSTAEISAYAWDFGDGSSSTEGAPTHSYTQSGNFAATLTVTATNGLTASSGKTIHVLEEPAAYPGRVPNPDIFVQARLDGPGSLDPAHSHVIWDQPILINVLETLVYYDRSRIDSLIPVLAQEVPSLANGLISPDGLNYTFNLRQGVKWHDGSEFTAADVEYTVERVMVMSIADGLFWILAEPLTGTRDAQPRSVIEDTVTVDGTYTVTFHLAVADSTFLQRLASFPARMVSKAYTIANGGWDPSVATDWDDWRGKLDPWMARNPMGTGPFKFVRWDSGQQVLLEANPTYRGGAPNFDNVVILEVSELSTRLLMLQAGDVDHAELPITQQSTIQAMDGVTIVSGLPTTRVDLIGFTWDINMIDQPAGTTINSTFFQDPLLRRAFTHAFPYEDYINLAFQGNAIRGKWFIPKGFFGYDETIPFYDYDTVQATLEFQQAWGGDVWTNGFEFTLYQWGGDEARIGAELIKENVEAINPLFKINIASPPFGPIYLPKWINRELPMMFGFTFALFADPQAYHGFIFGEGGPAYAWQAYSNLSVAGLVADAAVELDPVVRAGIFSQIQQAVHDDLIYISLVEPGNFDTFRTWLNGYFYNPMHGQGNLNFYTLSKG